MKRLILALALTALAAAARARDVEMPEFTGISRWLNTDQPLTKEGLKGKVVLVDFWTYSCINCIRTFPHVTSWHEKYAAQGLVIVGVHTPEFDFEKQEDNVRAALAKYGITYPVAMDNDYKTWRAYSNRYWPAHYLMDRQGRLRYTHFGEGKYRETEDKIRELLAEGGPAPVPAESPAPPEADLSRVKTPELYLGYERLSALGNRQKVLPDRRQTFREPQSLAPHRFSLAGDWFIAAKFARAEAAGAKILIRYEADKAHMVLDTADGSEAVVEVYIDGKPATADNKGADVALKDGLALCRVRSARLYNLSRNTGQGRHVLELRFRSPGVRAYTFTFG